MIFGYIKRRFEVEVIYFFLNMRNIGVLFIRFILGSVLSVIVSLKVFDIGLLVYVQVIK